MISDGVEISIAQCEGEMIRTYLSGPFFLFSFFFFFFLNYVFIVRYKNSHAALAMA